MRREVTVGAGRERRQLGMVVPRDDRARDALGLALFVDEAANATPATRRARRATTRSLITGGLSCVSNAQPAPR